MRYCLGLDLGSEVDPAAITIIKRFERFQEPDMTIPSHGVRKERRKVINELHAIYFKEIPLNTDYPVIVQKVSEIMNNPEWVDNIHLVIDRTGVGIPVQQLMINAKLNPIGVMITGGSQENVHEDHYNLPKRELVMNLLIAMHTKRFKLPQPQSVNPEMRKNLARFAEELGNFKMKINNRTKNIAYEAEQEKVHDDLVISTALAVWWLNKVYGDSPVVQVGSKGEEYPDYMLKE